MDFLFVFIFIIMAGWMDEITGIAILGALSLVGLKPKHAPITAVI